MKFWQLIKNLKQQTNSSWLTLGIFGLIIIALSLGQVARIEVSNVVTYPHDILIILWLIIQNSVTLSLLKECKSYILRTPVLLLFLLLLIASMAVAFFITGEISPWLYLIRILLYLLFLCSAYKVFQKNPSVLPLAAIVIGTIMMLFGVIQYMFLPDTRYLFSFGWDEHYYRLLGTLLDPNYTGLIFVVTLWGVLRLKKKFPKKLFLGLIAFFGISLVLTFSRASYLSLTLSGIVFLVLKSVTFSAKNFFSAIAASILLFSVFLITPKPGGEGVDLLRTNSILARYKASTQILNSMQPWQQIIGAGFYTLPTAVHDAQSHAKLPDNIFLTIFYSVGILGSVLLLSLLIQKRSLVSKLDSYQAAILVSLVTHAQFNNSILEPFVFLTVGMAIISLKK